MIETILGKDGITPEMIKAQQERLNLVDRLLAASAPDVRSQLIKDNAALLDEQFFVLFSRLLQAGLGGGQEALAKQLSELQKQLLTETEVGRRLQESVGELEAASKALQEAGPNLTTGEVAGAADPGAERWTRQGVRFAGAQRHGLCVLPESDREDRQGHRRARGRSSSNCVEKTLDQVNEVDKQLEARYKKAQSLVDKILAESDVAQATRDNLEAFTQEAVDLVQSLHRQASEKNEYERLGKLQRISEVLQAASAPPPEVALIERLLDAPDEAGVEKMLAANEAMINDAFMEALNGLVAQLDAQAQEGGAEAKNVAKKLQMVYKAALKFSMKKKMA